MLVYVNVVSSRLAQDIYTIRHEREMSTVKEIHAMLQAHVQLLDQVHTSHCYCYGCFTAVVLIFFLIFRRLISEVAWPIVTKLCHVVDGDPDL